MVPFLYSPDENPTIRVRPSPKFAVYSDDSYDPIHTLYIVVLTKDIFIVRKEKPDLKIMIFFITSLDIHIEQLLKISQWYWKKVYLVVRRLEKNEFPIGSLRCPRILKLGKI